MQNQEIFKRPVWKAIFSMGIPSLISVLVMIIYNMADMYFIGFLNDYTQVAAVSLIMPVFSIMTAVSMLLGNGGCTLIAQALGAGEKKRARSYMSLCIWTAILLGVIIAGLIIVFSNPLLKFLGTNEEMWQYARNYMLILAVGSPAMLLNYTIACLVRGEGVIKPGLIANFVSTGMNILWDPVLILGVKMGVSGAALATVLSNVIGIVYLIWYKMHHEMILTFNPKPARESVRHLGRVFALGFPRDEKLLKDAFNKKNSITVIAAPTGEGKTTTLYSIIDYLNRPEINITTIEDPVEIRIDGLNQIEIDNKTTFPGALRTVLRQDPDIILVGEIRDKETAEIAMQAGQTGHYVLSTIHTINSIEVVTRLRKMGISNYDIASTLATSVSQRLVRKLCPNCRKERDFTLEEKEIIREIGDVK